MIGIASFVREREKFKIWRFSLERKKIDWNQCKCRGTEKIT